MTAITANAATNMANDAGFRAWGQVWSTNLAALGWVKTADTGQIDWGTVTKPTVANTVAGFEIWRMNDTLQASAPIFLKIEYGTGTSATTSSLWITVGFATDGAGNIIGTNQSTRTQLASSLNSATAYDWKFSGDTNRLGVVETLYASAFRYLFIERTHASDGSDTTGGIMLALGGYTASSKAQLIPATGNLPPMTWYTNTIGNVAGGTSSAACVSNQWGSNVYLAPVRLFGMGETTPFLGLMSYFSTDLTTGNLTTVGSWPGPNITVFPTGMAPSYFSPLTGACIAMRFD